MESVVTHIQMYFGEGIADSFKMKTLKDDGRIFQIGIDTWIDLGKNLDSQKYNLTYISNSVELLGIMDTKCLFLNLAGQNGKSEKVSTRKV